jgi:hypothetical protein
LQPKTPTIPIVNNTMSIYSEAIDHLVDDLIETLEYHKHENPLDNETVIASLIDQYIFGIGDSIMGRLEDNGII